MSSQIENLIGFANTTLTEGNWRKAVLPPRLRRLLGVQKPAPDAPVLGVATLAEAAEIQARLRGVLAQVVDASGPRNFSRRAQVAETINQRAKLRPVVLKPHATKDELIQTWETESKSFEEYLYVSLGQALVSPGFRFFARCPNCGKFIYRKTAHGRQYCSNNCRALASFHRRRPAGRRQFTD